MEQPLSEQDNQTQLHRRLVQNLLTGLNAESKRIIELSKDQIQELTGIPNDEMFGTDETGEKVAYIGAPWQAKTIMDSERLFVFDYEYGEIANFTRSYDQIDTFLENELYDWRFGDSIEDLVQRIGNENTDLPDECKSGCTRIFDIVKELHEDVIEMVKHPNNDFDIQKIQNTRTIVKKLSSEIQKQKNLFPLYDTDRKSSAAFDPNDSRQVYDLFMSDIDSVVKSVRQSLKDIEDYNTLVLPYLDHYVSYLKENNTLIGDDELRVLIRQEEISYLNQLRLHKHTERSHVVATMFPFLPLADESMDRIVLSYSISTYLISDSRSDDFRSWWAEIKRVLKPGGKAYIFPMQQGFPLGRVYDDQSLEATLDEASIDNSLEWQMVENPNLDAWRQDTTLVLTKKEGQTGETSVDSSKQKSESVAREFRDLYEDDFIRLTNDMEIGQKRIFRCLVADEVCAHTNPIVIIPPVKTFNDVRSEDINFDYSYLHRHLYSGWCNSDNEKRTELAKYIANFDLLRRGFISIERISKSEGTWNDSDFRVRLSIPYRSDAQTQKKLESLILQLRQNYNFQTISDSNSSVEVEQLVKKTMFTNYIEEKALAIEPFVTPRQLLTYRRLARKYYIDGVIQKDSPLYVRMIELEQISQKRNK